MNRVQFLHGDCIEQMRTLPAGAVQCCVTSPPYYWQRDYGIDGQFGHEATPDGFVQQLVSVAREVRRVLADDGVFWLNLGDSYYSGNGQPHGSDPRSSSRDWMRRKIRPLDVAGLGVPKKSLLGMPWRVALALQADGWVLRSDVIWCRSSALPEPSVKDRPHRQHEYLFLLSKSKTYYFNRSALPEESVWHIPHRRGEKAHPAAFPEELASRCVLSASRPGDTVLDCFGGTGTVAVAAAKNGRNAILCELSETYIETAKRRVAL